MVSKAIQDDINNPNGIRDRLFSTCPQCHGIFLLVWDAGRDEKETLHIASCPSGGIYAVSVECPHCGLVESI